MSFCVSQFRLHAWKTKQRGFFGMNMPISVNKFSIIIAISKIQILKIFSHREKQNPYNIYYFPDLLTTFLENQFEAQLNQTPPQKYLYIYIYSCISIQKNKDHGTQSHLFMANRWGKSGNSDKFSFLGLQNHCGR